MVEKVEVDKVYYSKDGMGRIIALTGGIPTETDDVYIFGFISRHIRSLSETEEDAKNVDY